MSPYNVDSVLRRLFNTAEAVQYCRGYSVLRGDSISTAKAFQYCGGIASVLWGIASVLWGIASVLQRDSISTVEG